MRKIHKILIMLSIVLVFQLLIASVGYAAPPSASPRYHIVRRCETLFSIGRLYNVSPYAIARANSLWNPNVIYVGQCLYIPWGPPYPGGWCCWRPSPRPCRRPGPWCCIYIVKRCDTLYSIAGRYGVSAWTLARNNGIPNPDYIWAGQRLSVPCYGGGGYCRWDP